MSIGLSRTVSEVEKDSRVGITITHTYTCGPIHNDRFRTFLAFDRLLDNEELLREIFRMQKIGLGKAPVRALRERLRERLRNLELILFGFPRYRMREHTVYQRRTVSRKHKERMTTMNRFQPYFAAMALSTILSLPAVLRADCPNGSRSTSDAERQAYMAALNALKNVPPAPAGWQLQLPRVGRTEAPTHVCNGLKLTPEYDVTYVSTEHQRLNQLHYSESNARIAALQKLPPEEQNQIADFTRQGSQLAYQARTAQKNNNPEEAARLNNQAREFSAKAKAIRQAHMEKIAPQVKAIRDDYYATQVNPEIKVHLAMDEGPIAVSVNGVEKVQIDGIPLAFFDAYGSLVMSLGRDAAGRNIRAEIKGIRELVLKASRLFTESSLLTLAAR